MSKFKAGDKVHVEFDAVVSEVQHNGHFWVNRASGGSSIIRDEWAEKILPVLPTAEGSVIKVTRWAGREQVGWVALLRKGGSWAISAEWRAKGLTTFQELSYAPRHLQERLSAGSFDFEVLFDASKGANQ